MRINHVAKARKPQGDCEHCSKPIQAGAPYKWVKGRYGPKRSRHDSCPTWRPSELTGSDKLAAAYGAQEDVYDALSDWHPGYEAPDASDVEAALDEAASRIRDEVAEGYRESAQNMEDGFGHATSTTEELESKADEADSWADEVEGAKDQWEEPPTIDHLPEGTTWKQAVDEWAETVRQAAEEAVAQCPF